MAQEYWQKTRADLPHVTPSKRELAARKPVYLSFPVGGYVICVGYANTHEEKNHADR